MAPKPWGGDQSEDSGMGEDARRKHIPRDASWLLHNLPSLNLSHWGAELPPVSAWT